MKKPSLIVVSVLVVAVLAMGLLAGCGSKTESAKYKIGVSIYDNTDLQQQMIKKYLVEYVAPAFNVDFVYSEGVLSSNAELSFMENCASSGVRGIISINSPLNDPKMLYDKCKELGLYYVRALVPLTDAEITAGTGNEYAVGGVSPLGDYDIGYDMAKTFLAEGARTFVIATGGANYGITSHLDRTNGAKAAIAEFEQANPGTTIKVDYIEGFPGDAFYAKQAQLIATDPDVVIATFAGEDLWLQPIADAGKAGKIKLGTVSSINDVTAQAVKDGSMSYLGAVYSSMVGPSFALLYNAITGHAADFRENGKPLSVSQNYVIVRTAEEMTNWMTVLNADEQPYSVDDLKSVCKDFNPDATMDQFIALSKACTYDDIVARRAADK